MLIGMNFIVTSLPRWELPSWSLRCDGLSLFPDYRGDLVEHLRAFEVPPHGGDYDVELRGDRLLKVRRVRPSRNVALLRLRIARDRDCPAIFLGPFHYQAVRLVKDDVLGEVE